MKKVYTGWIGKNRNLSHLLHWCGSIYPHLDFDETLYKKKQTKEDWSESNWPPVKVTITIEVEG